MTGSAPVSATGTLHPINIIWGNRSIRAVIDWEFCGTKPEIYDLANLLGCLGVENPQSLDGPFVHQVIRRMRTIRRILWPELGALPDMMLAIRFAWLSEWLRKDDLPMIRLEADYMALLLEHRSWPAGGTAWDKQPTQTSGSPRTIKMVV
jgi:homoserine kinase type II